MSDKLLLDVLAYSLVIISALSCILSFYFHNSKECAPHHLVISEQEHERSVASKAQLITES